MSGHANDDGQSVFDWGQKLCGQSLFETVGLSRRSLDVGNGGLCAVAQADTVRTGE
jgi:hypothetical protein